MAAHAAVCTLYQSTSLPFYLSYSAAAPSQGCLYREIYSIIQRAVREFTYVKRKHQELALVIIADKDSDT